MNNPQNNGTDIMNENAVSQSRGASSPAQPVTGNGGLSPKKKKKRIFLIVGVAAVVCIALAITAVALFSGGGLKMEDLVKCNTKAGAINVFGEPNSQLGYDPKWDCPDKTFYGIPITGVLFSNRISGEELGLCFEPQYSDRVLRILDKKCKQIDDEYYVFGDTEIEFYPAYVYDDYCELWIYFE